MMKITIKLEHSLWIFWLVKSKNSAQSVLDSWSFNKMYAQKIPIIHFNHLKSLYLLEEE